MCSEDCSEITKEKQSSINKLLSRRINSQNDIENRKKNANNVIYSDEQHQCFKCFNHLMYTSHMYTHRDIYTHTHIHACKRIRIILFTSSPIRYLLKTWLTELQMVID